MVLNNWGTSVDFCGKSLNEYVEGYLNRQQAALIDGKEETS